MWKGFALFDPQGTAKEAWQAFQPTLWTTMVPKTTTYMEVNQGTLYQVPFSDAKKSLRETVNRLRKKTGGVSQEHIGLLNTTELKVGPYRVDLRSSLQQNLKMELVEVESGVRLSQDENQLKSELQSLVKNMNPASDKVVLIHRQEMTLELKFVVSQFEKQGIQVDLHPKFDSRMLQFGMCGQFVE